MKALFWTLVTAALICSAQGKDIYVAQREAGDGSGHDLKNPVSLGWFNTATNWGVGESKITAGDTVHFLGTLTNSAYAQSGGINGSPITLKFEPDAKFVLSAKDCSVAIGLGNFNYLTIDGGTNGLIEYTDNGTALAYQTTASGIVGTPTSGNIEIKNLTINNVYIHVPGTADTKDLGAGIYLRGKVTNVSIHNCTVTNVQKGIFFVYNPGGSSNVRFYSNTFQNVSWGIGLGDAAEGAILDGLYSYDNRVSGLSVWDTSNNWFHENGTYFWAEQTGSYITNVFIYRNRIGPDLGSHTTAGIFLSSSAGSGVKNVFIYNNVIFGGGGGNGAIYGQNCQGVNVFNNTLNASRHISFAGGRDVTLNNNLFANLSVPVGFDTVSNSRSCDYSLYFNLNPWNGSWGDSCQFSYSTWRLLGHDTHSVVAAENPFVASSDDFRLRNGSSAIGAGVNLSALTAPDIDKDYEGKLRPKTWSIGAYEGASVPAGPSLLRILKTP